MKRSKLKPVSPKRRERLDEAAAAIEALRLVVGWQCEWCQRHRDTDPHHVGGRIGNLLADTDYIVLLCRLCHTAIERMACDDGTAVGLCLLRHAGRGTVRGFWKATGRNWPSEELVEHWMDRLERR